MEDFFAGFTMGLSIALFAVKGKADSALSLGYRDKDGKNRIAVGYVGEDGILPDVWYCANEKGELVKS